VIWLGPRVDQTVQNTRMTSVSSLPTKGYVGTPGTTRTCNLRIRSPLLYPVELRGQEERARWGSWSG
jgi:hypothetical protein